MASGRISLDQGIFSVRPPSLSDLLFLINSLQEFPGVGNRETGGPEQGAFAAEQRTSTAHHATSSGVTGAQYARRL